MCSRADTSSGSEPTEGKRRLAGRVDYVALSRDLVDGVESGVYIVQSRKFVYVNPFFEKLTGYSREELIGMRSSKLVLPQDRPAVKKKATRNLKSRLGSKPYEYRFIRKNGETRWVMERVSPIEYMGQKAALGNFIDITEHKKVEQALSESESQYRLLADNMRDQVWLMDLNLKPTYASPSVERLRGYTFEELEQLPIDRQLTATSFQTAMEFFSKELPKALADPTYFARPLELEWCCKDGSTLWVDSTFSQVRDENGELVSLLGVGREISERKRNQDEMNRQQAFLRQVIDSSPNLIFVKDRDDRYLLANKAIANAYGTTPAYMQGKTDLELGVPAEEFAKYRQDDIEVLQSGKEKIIPDENFTWQSGEVHYYHTTKRPLLDEKGEFNSILAVSVDITNRKKAEDNLRESEERYRNILRELQDSYIELDLVGNFTFVNEATCRNLGYTMEELIGQNFSIIASGQDEVKTIFKAYNKVYKTGESHTGFAFKVKRKDGSIGYAETSISLIKNEQGKPIGFRSVGRDVTERKQFEQKLEEMATHDALTGLPNRTLLQDRFGIAVANAQRNKKKVAIMSLDLDLFKNVNDMLGHDMGDKLLIAAAGRLTGALRKSDTVVRMGGDEFVLLLWEVDHKDDAVIVAEKISEDFRQPFVINGHSLNVTTSIGIATYPEDAEDLETLTKKSDAAMYYSKDHGRNQFKFFSDVDVRAVGDQKNDT